jgi:outer membrane immunogenic protein
LVKNNNRTVMRTLVTGAVAALVFASGSALAADLPTKAPIYKAPAAVYNWSGFYIGAHAGAAWGDTTATDEKATNGSCWNRCGFQWTGRPNGFVGGGQAGYNWQIGNFVLGVEADVGFLGTRGSKAAPISSDTIVHTDGGFYATARGRLGLAFDSILV